MDQMQFISIFRFTIQLLISEAVFLIGIPRRKDFPVRLFCSAVCYSLSAAAYYKMILSPGPVMATYIALWILLFGLSLCVIFACFDVSFEETLFIGVGGYATEHIAFAVTKIVQYITGMDAEAIGVIPEYLLFRLLPYILAAALVYFFVIRKNRRQTEAEQKDKRLIILAMVILFTAIVLSGITDSLSGIWRQSLLGQVICPLYSMVCAVLVILIEFFFSRENRLTREREIMEQMLQMSYAQQKSSKEAIDIINIKCHDLKHQMGLLTRIDDKEQRHQYIDEMRRAVSIYDASYQTGCESLDYILREKTLLCDEYEITFSCMADGGTLGFMEAPDIYALFGNMLDNAIESAQKEPIPQKRCVSLRMNRQGQMVHIHIENTCPDHPRFIDGIPVTTKADQQNHGYGVRSICYIVKKYQGQILMRVRDGRFLLDIVLPEDGK